MLQDEITNRLQDFRQLLKNKRWLDDDPLWMFISALRGPDTEDYKLKLRTTWRLRNAIIPEFFEQKGYFEAPDKPEVGESIHEFLSRINLLILEEFPDSQHHFRYHYVIACWYYWQEQANTQEQKLLRLWLGLFPAESIKE